MDYKNIITIKGERFVKCPYCNETYKSLTRHIPYTHGIYMDAYHKEYPNYCTQIGDSALKEDSRRELNKPYEEYYEKYLKDDGLYHCPVCNKGLKKVSGLQEHSLTHGISMPSKESLWGKDIKAKNLEYTCPYCGGAYKNYQGLRVHQSMSHKKEYLKALEEEKKKIVGFECPICHETYVGLADHIRAGHHLSWEKFCEDYNWIWGGSYISEEHRKNLSLNKKHFYQKTERGKELREQQSRKVTNNLEKGIIGLHERTGVTCTPLSYYFTCASGPYRVCRSFQEYAIIYVLQKYNIEYEYEPTGIEYMREGIAHLYTPDLLINNIFFEIKSCEDEFKEDIKYRIVENILSKTPYKLKLLTLKNYPEILNVRRVDLQEIYRDIKVRFENDKSFYVHGRLISNQKRNLRSSLLRLIFKEDYDRFVEENLKRIQKIYENN